MAAQDASQSTISAMNAAIVLCGACYQRFWARDRHQVLHLLEDLLQLAARLEGRAQGEVLTVRRDDTRLYPALGRLCVW